MDDLELGGLSKPELDLLSQFLSTTQETPMTETVANTLTTQEKGAGDSFGAGVADVLHYISDTVTATDRQVLRLNDMRESLQRVSSASPQDEELPEDAEITPEKLQWLSIRSKLTSYYTQVGILLEEFSTELILEEVVNEDRRSNNIKKRIEGKSQSEKEWLLWVTGVITHNERDAIRTSYQKRNDLVHNSISQDETGDTVEIESDINEGGKPLIYSTRSYSA